MRVPVLRSAGSTGLAEMGTIGDRLAALLPEGWDPTASDSQADSDGSGASSASETAAEVLATAAQSVAGETDSSAGPRAQTVALLLEHTDASPEDFDPQMRLAADLDLDGLPLWGFVADLERVLCRQFPDVAVTEWVTVGDVLQAVETDPAD